MAGSRLRAFRSYGTTANLRASLLEFGSTGGGLCTSLISAAHGRIHALTRDIEGLHAASFDKVVARFLTLGGEAMLPVSDPLQEREALVRACLALPVESPFYACREYGGFVRRLAVTLRELRAWRYSPQTITEAAEKAEPYLGAKLKSLAFLEERLRDGLRAAARELETERIERCFSLKIPSGNRSRIWVYSGGDFAPLWADFLSWAARNEVEVWLVCDGHASVARHCQGAERMLDRLQLQAPFIGGANGLAEGLFASQPRLDVGLNVRISSTADPLSEVEWALRSIKKEAEAGLPWARCAVYARNLEEYAPLLKSAAERFGVPLRMPRREGLPQNGWMKILLSYLEACGATTPEKLKEIAASSYLGLANESAGHYRAMINLSLSNHESWENLSQRLDPANESDKWLFEAVRLHGKIGLGAISFREWYDELLELVEESWLSKALTEDSPTKIRDIAARSALLHALEQRTALGESAGEEIDLGQFNSEVKRVCEQSEYAWPGTEEGIDVVSSTYALSSAEILCVLGMIEGSFPRRRSEDPILSDAERSALDGIKAGVPLKSSHDDARAERDELVRLCGAAGRDLHLFYPQVGDDRDNTPAFYLAEIERVAGGSVEKHDMPSAKIVPLAEECLFEADSSLQRALSEGKTFPSELRLETGLAQELIKGMPENGTSPRELADSLRCSFQYIFKRRLGLRPVRSESKWHLLRYLPESARLTVSPDAETARNSLLQALENQLDELGPETSLSERKLLEAGGRREIKGWIDREFVSRQIWRGEETDWKAEVCFGENGTAAELPMHGANIKLRGRLAGIGDLKGYVVGQLYGGRSYGVGRNLDKIEDPDMLELGVYIWSLCKRRQNVALEVDTTSGERLLMVLPKPEDFDIESRVGQGLRVVELGEKQEFYERVKGLLKVSVERIADGHIGTQSGDHCRHCDYGDLCRRAQGFGEQLDPFEAELGIGR